MDAFKKAAILLSVPILTLGAQAHEFKKGAKAPPSMDDVYDANEFDQLVMNAPDDGARWVLSRTLLWRPGSTLRACFMNGSGSEASRAAVINDAEYLVGNQAHPVNLKIAFSDGSGTNCKGTGPYTEDIRVSFTEGCCSAYVGRVSHNVAVAKGANVFLQDGLDDPTVKHELLHALGFQHEHQRPDSPCDFNYDVIATAYGWSMAEVRNNFDKLDKNSSKLADSPAFDGASIMKYYFDPSFLKQGTSSPCYEPRAADLSPGDWDGLRKAYPQGFDVAQFKETVNKKRAVGASLPAGALQDAFNSSVSDY